MKANEILMMVTTSAIMLAAMDVPPSIALYLASLMLVSAYSFS